MKYLNSFLEKKCAGDLLYLFHQSKNPAKEISESYGAYRNMKEFINVNDLSAANICIGDGSLCMTGVLLSFLTKNFNICIDPLINKIKMDDFVEKKNVKRFMTIKSKFQDVNINLKEDFFIDSYNIICVHAHVNIEEVVKKFPNWNYLYTNPCCKRDKQTFSLKFQRENNIVPVLAGVDHEILSDKNEVIIYKNGRV